MLAGRGMVVVGVMRTGCSTSGVEVEEVVVLRLRTDKIEGNCAWEGRWLIYLAGLLLSTPPPCRTHRLPAAGSEVEGADNSLGANIIDRYGRTRCQGGWMLGQESSARASTALATSVLLLYNFFFLMSWAWHRGEKDAEVQRRKGRRSGSEPALGRKPLFGGPRNT